MEPRRYMSLATWAKDRVARLESLSNDVADANESDEIDAANVVSFSAAIELAPSQLNEAA